jgi:hypothetical protein
MRQRREDIRQPPADRFATSQIPRCAERCSIDRALSALTAQRPAAA